MAADELLRPIVVLTTAALHIPFHMMVVAWPMMGVWSGGHAWNGTADSVWPWLLAWLLFLGTLLRGGFCRAAFGASSREADTALEELRVAAARDVVSSEAFEERCKRLRREWAPV